MHQLGLLDPQPPPAPILALRDYQQQAIDAVLAGQARGITRPLLVLPTGAGKTVVFCHLARRLNLRTLILAHREELIEQAMQKMYHVDPSADVGIVKAERDQHARRIVVASVQTLQQPRRLARFDAATFGLVIVDEAHHATAKGYRTILRHLGAFGDGGPLVVGVTATPDRSDGVGLKAVFQEVVFQRDLRWMIDAGYLVEPRGVLVRLQALDLKAVKTSAGDYQDGALGAALDAAQAPAIVAAAYQRHAADRTAIAYWPTVATAEAGAAAMRAVGIRAEALDGTTDPAVRRRLIADLGAGRLDCLHNCGVLTEGTDIPAVSCIVIARPTKSRALYSQIVGRGLRLADGKDSCVVLDVVGATRQHQLVTVASLLGNRPGEGERGDSRQGGSTKGEGLPIGQPLDPTTLFSDAVNLFARSPLRWLAAGRGFLMPAGEGWLMVEPIGPGGAEWRVVHRQGRDAAPYEVLAGLGLPEARALADRIARGLGVTATDRRGGVWRDQPASQRQLDALSRWHVVPNRRVSAGEASDMLLTVSALAAWRKTQRGGH